MQVLNRVSLAIAVVAVVGVLIILGALLGRGDSPGYSVVIAFVILVSSVPVGMPVVTTTVLAVGAREMAKQKAIVNRQSPSQPPLPWSAYEHNRHHREESPGGLL